MHIRVMTVGVLIVAASISGCRRKPPPAPPQPVTVRVEMEIDGAGDPVFPEMSGANDAATETTALAITSDAAPTQPQRQDTPLEPGFVLLTLADFLEFHGDVRPEQAVWTETEKRMFCRGMPEGYLYSRDSFRNFTMRMDFRYVPAAEGSGDAKLSGDAGFLAYITGDHKIWPLGMVVELAPAEIGKIHGSGGAAEAITEDRPEVRDQNPWSVDEWREMEIISRDGSLTVKLGGENVCTAEPNFLSEGPIGFQVQGHAFEISRLRIRRDP